jgi:DNA adenine methylase
MGRDSASATMGRKSSFRLYVGDKRACTVNDWCNYPAALQSIISRLRGVAIENRDALKVMKTYDGKEVLHYVDPPYVHGTRDDGRDYRHEMDDSEHEALLKFLKNLKGMVVLSGYECDLYSDLLGDWRKFTRKAFADGTRERTEVLWLSPNCSKELNAV